MLAKKIISYLLAVGMMMPILSQAGNLIVTNNTRHDSTSIINRSACSSILGETGITRAGHTNVIPEKIVNRMCYFSPTDCVADVYMTANCSGAAIATVHFSTTTGFISRTMHDPSYDISGAGFTITLSGGPALASKK